MPARHPDEHAAFGFHLEGNRRWRSETGGFVHGLAIAGEQFVAPVAQNVRR